jgi:SAM-dependent methyltransferase
MAGGSIEVARVKPGAERVRGIHGDAMGLPPMQVDVVTMTANVAQAVVDLSDWQAKLLSAHAALRPGGHLVFETRDPASRAWVDLIGVEGSLVRFRWTWVFASDGETLLSDSTLRFRQCDEIEQTLRRPPLRMLPLTANLVWIGAPGCADRHKVRSGEVG